MGVAVSAVYRSTNSAVDANHITAVAVAVAVAIGAVSITVSLVVGLVVVATHVGGSGALSHFC